MQPPGRRAAPAAEVTMVVSADELAKALEPASPPAAAAALQPRGAGCRSPAARDEPEPAPSRPAAAHRARPDRRVARRREPRRGRRSVRPPRSGRAVRERASPLRVAVALLVIVVLIAAIVLLVLDALPR